MRVFSFTKADRILKHLDFVRISKKGKRLQDTYFTAVYSTGRLERTRLGITVTKKVGNAAVRNRIKRIIRECFRLEKQKIKGCWDINIIAKKAAEAAGTDQMFSSLQGIFKKIEGKFDN